MSSLLELLIEWEIQMLVLLSFILQVFLFFTGSIRQRSTDRLLRGTIWLAYLGADVVAIYALGNLSRHRDDAMVEIHPLAFFWAPFLLIHLGGQDTITAFAVEDSNLWLRHLLNLLVQVILAIYVFWKSSIWRNNVQILVSGVLLFTAGIIKYGERTMALMYGNLNNNRASAGVRIGEEKMQQLFNRNVYYQIVCLALSSAESIRLLFQRRLHIDQVKPNLTTSEFDHDVVVKLLDVELSVIYNDIYTKATILLRTRSGVVLRCICHVSTVAALVIFAVMSNKEAVSRYGRIDIAITYTLFIGGILLEVCAVFTVLLASPWTWALLEDRGYHNLAPMSWSLVSSSLFGRSGRMGQYSCLSYMGCYDEQLTLSQRMMSMIRKTARAVNIRGKEKKLLAVSKLLDTWYEPVDDGIMKCVVEEIRSLRSQNASQHAGKWRHMGSFLKEVEPTLVPGFPFNVWQLHIITEFYLSSSSTTTSAEEASCCALAQVCRKLSNYMLYLFAVHPAASMLRVAFAISPEELFFLDASSKYISSMGGNKGKDATLRANSKDVKDAFPSFPWNEPCEEVLKELRDTWVRFLIYAAGKSRPEAHATQLARGRELLTFVWVLMAHCGLGDCTLNQVEPTHPSPGDRRDFKVFYAFEISNIPVRTYMHPAGIGDGNQSAV